jgi:hypothetical protein
VETIELAGTRNGAGGPRPSLLRVLADAGVAGEEELRLAFAEAMGTGERFGEIVLRRGWVNEEGLAAALAQQRGIPYLVDAEVDRDAVKLLGGAAVAAELGACPVHATDAALLVAVADPSEERFGTVRTAIGAEPDFAVVTAPVLERLVARAIEIEDTAKREAADAHASRIADDEQRDASLRSLDGELEAATTQLVRLRERVGEVIASDGRHQRDLAECRQQIARLTETVAADRERIRSLEAELADQRERIAAARKKLIEAGDSLGN